MVYMAFNTGNFKSKLAAAMTEVWTENQNY